MSVLFAIADEQTSAAVLAAHERAVEAAFAYVEREACFTRRGRNGAHRVRGDGFLATAYRHRLSRAGDPQLHTHVVAANMTRAEGRSTTLEAHGLYEHVSAGGAVYRAVLRAEVRAWLPWVRWRQVARGLFEIEGVPDGLLREFSRRRVEIEERALALTGRSPSSLSRERLQGIALQTRKAKEYGVDGARWRQEARARAAEHGFSKLHLDRLAGSEARTADASEADVARSATRRLSGPEGLTANHNTFARRHALAEIAYEFEQGATTRQLERATRGYLQHASVVSLGRVDGEDRFTTRGLLEREQAITESAERRRGGRTGVVHPRLPELAVGDPALPLNDEQAAAVGVLANDGHGVSVLQALAGTGKTRVLAALARIYERAGYQVLGAAPTGRAARELGDAAGIPAFTIHRLLYELEAARPLISRSVILFDEAGMAPTRASAELFARAERAGAKIIAAGDSGQLPSVAPGGWFGAISRYLEGPKLREVMRQRDRNEREALAALHDGNPAPWLQLKYRQGALHAHEQEEEALADVLADWDRARHERGPEQAVMIARDNTTRAALNERARRLLVDDGTVAAQGVTIAHQLFGVGDRVIARRNDRYREVDNGTLARIIKIDRHTGTVTVLTDAGHERQLDAAYAAAHLENAYALTGHGAQGATVQWAGVIGRPSEFTREWTYTSFSRARDQTHVYVIAEAGAWQRERERYAASQPRRSARDAVSAMALALRRRDAERLAVEAITPPALPMPDQQHSHKMPFATLPEAGAEKASPSWATRSPPEPNWQALRAMRASRGRRIGR